MRINSEFYIIYYVVWWINSLLGNWTSSLIGAIRINPMEHNKFSIPHTQKMMITKTRGDDWGRVFVIWFACHVAHPYGLIGLDFFYNWMSISDYKILPPTDVSGIICNWWFDSVSGLDWIPRRTGIRSPPHSPSPKPYHFGSFTRRLWGVSSWSPIRYSLSCSLVALEAGAAMEGASADDAAKGVADLSMDSGNVSAGSETLSKK